MSATNNETTGSEAISSPQEITTVVSEEETSCADAAAAKALVIEWADSISHINRTSPRVIHAERLFREAVSTGMMRAKVGTNPTTILVKALSHSRTWDRRERHYVTDAAHLSALVNLKSVHVYLNPNNNDTGAGHSVSRITAVRTRESRAADRERRMTARLA